MTTSAVATHEPWQDYSNAIKTRSTVGAHGPDLFGDSVNLYTGGLSFSVTDISLPGNSGLPVAVTRTFQVVDRPEGIHGLPLGDWDLDIPHISGVYATTWPSNRCSSLNPPSVPLGYQPHEIWNGLHANMPGGGELLVANQTTPRPTNAQYIWLTSDLTYFSCQTTLANPMSGISGEGFVALTADGTTYEFRHMAQADEPWLIRPTTPSTPPLPVQRKRNMLYVTKVKDRFNNEVTYHYSNAANQPVKLDSIRSPDGRRIDFAYTNGRVSSATAYPLNGTDARTWDYNYTAGGLSGVVLPDDSAWIIDFPAFSGAAIAYSPVKGNFNCEHFATLQTSDQSFSGTVTHPSGASGTFVVTPQRHARSNVPLKCENAEGPVFTDDYAWYVRDFFSLSLASKLVSGPMLQSMSWQYTYTSGLDEYIDHTPCIDDDEDGVLDCLEVVCQSDSCAGSKSASVSGPNSKETYFFGNSFHYNEGKLLKIERRDPTARAEPLMETETNIYELARIGLDFSAMRGTSLRPRGDGYVSAYPRPLKLRTTDRDGGQYLWAMNDFDAYARVSQVTKSNTSGQSRVEISTYEDRPTPWVVGQPKTLTVNGIAVSEVVYGATNHLPQTRKEYGRTINTYEYWPDGNLRYLHDALSRTTTLGPRVRGIPTSVSFPDATSISAQINVRGEIDWTQDQLGYKTNYTYDSMGRIASIDYPDADTVNWSNRFTTFAKVPASPTPPYGVPAGAWRQSTSEGNYRKDIYFDALWRPILTREYDAAAPGDTMRIVKRDFDHAGRETQTSYPVDALTAWNSVLPGTTQSFDPLGRLRLSTQSSEHGLLSTTIAYPAFNRKTVTNPRTHATTYHFLAYDRPDESMPLQIDHPHGAQVFIERNALAMPTSVRQEGGTAPNFVSATRRFVYDGFYRLCKRVEPETSATVIQYDAVDNVHWSATGQNLPGQTTCNHAQVQEAAKTYRGYDAMNRLTAINYPGATVDSYYSYELDGLMHSAWSDQWNPDDDLSIGRWTYTYNKRRLLEIEKADMGAGKSKSFYYTHNALGHVDAIQDTFGVYVDYQPNALGQPTQAWPYTTLNSVRHFPNGALKQFTYGNGLTRINTQNGRKLIDRTRDTYGSTVRHDFSYTFDKNGNVASITDIGGAGFQTRNNITYDAANRLENVTAMQLWGGAANYTYDALDNIRTVTAGGSTRTYNYTTSWHLSSVTSGGSQVWGLWHDANGNMTVKGSDWYVFDDANRMLSVLDTNQPLPEGGYASKVDYYYDAHGRRFGEIRPGLSKYSMYTRDGLLRAEWQNENEQLQWTANIYLGGKLLATERRPVGQATTRTYYHTDALGSPVLETNAARAVTATTQYAPYGLPLGGNGMPLVPNLDTFGFTGHVHDGPSGLIYMQQRYYDPAIGRFISVDPLPADPQNGFNFNRYWYADNNPLTFIDPDGLQSCAGSRLDCDNTSASVKSFDLSSGPAGGYRERNSAASSGPQGPSSGATDERGFLLDGYSPASGAYQMSDGTVALLGVNEFGNALVDANGAFYTHDAISGSVSPIGGQGAVNSVHPEAYLIGGPVLGRATVSAGSALAHAVGPLKQWARLGPSYSRTMGQQVSLSFRWGASPARGGVYINQIGSPALRNFNQYLRGLKLPGQSWRVRDAGHLHLRP